MSSHGVAGGVLPSIQEERSRTGCGVSGVTSRDVLARKQEERTRVYRQQELEQTEWAIGMTTHTKHAPGDSLKAEALSLSVGSAHLLEEAKLVISEQTKCYGLVGPNGCGKTTLLRLIAGAYAPEHQLPIPRNWGEPYLVDQLDPEPTGRSPVEEVLAGCKERTEVLEQKIQVEEKLSKIDAQVDGCDELTDEEQAHIDRLWQQLQEVEHHLSKWSAAERDVTRILVGLGFHDGSEPSSDGAPSLRAKDEIVMGAAGLQINGLAEVRDSADEEWMRGTVTSMDPLCVRPDGWKDSYLWLQVRQARELSGGWRKKVQLAKGLWMKPRLLLLDEPTNHLDFHARLWLEEELKTYPHTLVIVSHNACFLSDVCNKALHIIDKRIDTLPMADLNEDKLMLMQRQDERNRKFRDWRFAYPRGDEPEMHGLSFHDVSFSYLQDGPQVVHNLGRNQLRVNGKSRTVLVGRNGSGKSTILKLCLGVVEPTKGEVDVSCKVNHFSQHFNEELDRHPDMTAAGYLARFCREGLVRKFRHTDEDRLFESACEVLSWFGLSQRGAARTSIRDLSGGEKARVNFSFLCLEPAHLLFLDEPTNHLDANGLDHLADAIDHFQGGVVLVSHDELLIRRLLGSVDHSQLLICACGTVAPQRAGSAGLDAYRREALLEQYQRAETAAFEVERRIQQSQEPRRRRLRRSSAATASTAASTPRVTPASSRASSQTRQEAEKPLQSLGGHDGLEKFFARKQKKKPANLNQNRKK